MYQRFVTAAGLDCCLLLPERLVYGQLAQQQYYSVCWHILCMLACLACFDLLQLLALGAAGCSTCHACHTHERTCSRHASLLANDSLRVQLPCSATQVTSLQELKALETQINEFGQTPKQLFTHPHPPRMVQPPAPDPATVFNHTTSSSSSNPIGDRAAATAGASPGSAAAVAAAGVAGKARLKGGGEDAAGGALCFALLSTIMAAAAPDIQASAAAGEAAAAAAAGEASAATAALAVPQGPAGSSSMQRMGSNSSGLSLSPVSSSDLLSAAPCRVPSPLRKVAQQQQQHQQDQQAGGTGLRSMLGRLTDTATAAAGSAAARVASAMQSAGSGTASNGSTGSRTGSLGLAGMPVSSSKSGIKLSLSWMQQQFEEGLALSSKASSSSISSSTEPAAAGTAAATQSADSTTSSSPPTAAAASGLPPSSAGRHAAGRLGVAGLVPVQWPRRLPEQLLVKKSLRLQSEPLTAVAALPDDHVVVAGHSGLLRVLEAPQLSTIRSVKLSEEDLLCLSLLPAAPSAVRPAAAAAAKGGATGSGLGSSASDVQLPLVLAGSQTGRVFAYAAIAGQPLGSFAPHNDAVSSMLQLGHAGGRLATASWDCTVKVRHARVQHAHGLVLQLPFYAIFFMVCLW
jgi:hypothetical protein